tara:strand:- start:58 stop:486 length:429 start_codon:yes stop_codon:yes gene_type:complete
MLKFQMFNFELDTCAPTDGTSFSGYVTVPPALLVRLFGLPNHGDDHKVSGEYRFRNMSGNTVCTLYDWKTTTMYDQYAKFTAEDFWQSNEPYRFHLGGDSIGFQTWLSLQIGEYMMCLFRDGYQKQKSEGCRFRLPYVYLGE